MDEQVRKQFQARLDAPPDSPLEATRKFLHSYVSDADSIAQIRQDIARMITVNPRTILAGLAGIEALLSSCPIEENELSYLVAVDGNWVLEDPSDEGAKIWLRDLAKLIREQLRDEQSSI